jgi:hypothetical protein
MLKDVTVVIPTIGEKKIFRTVYLLNNVNYLRPACIIISVHFSRYNKVKLLEKLHNNIVIVKTTKKSQVLQRIKGFQKCKTKFALQLDADCFINSKDVLILKKQLIKLGPKSSIAPVFLDILTDKPLYQLKLNIFNDIKDKIAGFKSRINKMGQVASSCLNFGVDVNFMSTDILKTEWLAGGCILHYRSNLIKRNYYPFSGKAYCEDLIHSKILRNNKISLYVTRLSICRADMPIFPKKLKEIYKFLVAFNYLQKYYTNYSRVKFFLAELFYKKRLIFSK